MAEQTLAGDGSPTAQKPIGVMVALQGGDVTSDDFMVPLGSTVREAMEKAGFHDAIAAVKAGRAHVRIRNNPATLDQRLEDGDNVIITQQVKGGLR